MEAGVQAGVRRPHARTADAPFPRVFHLSHAFSAGPTISEAVSVPGTTLPWPLSAAGQLVGFSRGRACRFTTSTSA
jgi:hypothetical protein